MQDIRTLKKMILELSVILDKKQRLQIVGVFFIIFIGSLLELLGVSIILPFIQALIEPHELMQKDYIRILTEIFNIHDTDSVIIMVGIAIVTVYLLKNAYLIFSAYIQASYSSNTQKSLSVLMYRSYLNRPYEFFLEAGSGEIIRGVTTDTSGVYNVILNGFKLVSELLVVASIAVYLMIVDVRMASGVLIVGFACMLLIVLVMKKRISSYARISRETGKNRNRWLVQGVAGIKDIKVFDRVDYFINGYEIDSEIYARANTKNTFVNALPERLIEAFCVSGIIISILIRFAAGMNTKDFVIKMAVFAMGAFRILPSIARLTGYINTMVYNRPMVEATYQNINEARKTVLSLMEKVSDEEDDKNREFSNNIEARNIEWRYKGGKKKTLDGLNLTIKKGEVIGIIGESGAGKTTLADLLLCLYQPQKGGIYMDGMDVRSIPHTWSGRVSYIPQTVFLMDDTIRINVTFGLREADDEKVWKVLTEASLDKFVRGLPKGLDTIVGERGVKFSGGQRQRIAIARALYSEPQILIMDEATSALDNDTENAVMEAIDSLAGSITMIIIAHRLTTLKNCDRIYKITDGKAVEQNKEIVNL